MLTIEGCIKARKGIVYSPYSKTVAEVGYDVPSFEVPFEAGFVEDPVPVEGGVVGGSVGELTQLFEASSTKGAVQSEHD